MYLEPTRDFQHARHGYALQSRSKWLCNSIAHTLLIATAGLVFFMKMTQRTHKDYQLWLILSYIECQIYDISSFQVVSEMAPPGDNEENRDGYKYEVSLYVLYLTSAVNELIDNLSTNGFYNGFYTVSETDSILAHVGSCRGGRRELEGTHLNKFWGYSMCRPLESTSLLVFN